MPDWKAELTLPVKEPQELVLFRVSGPYVPAPATYNFSYPLYCSGAFLHGRYECDVMAVGPRFFETMKMPILSGRDFGSQDERPIAAAQSKPALHSGFAARCEAGLRPAVTLEWTGGASPASHRAAKPEQRAQMTFCAKLRQQGNIACLKVRTSHLEKVSTVRGSGWVDH